MRQSLNDLVGLQSCEKWKKVDVEKCNKNIELAKTVVKVNLDVRVQRAITKLLLDLSRCLRLFLLGLRVDHARDSVVIFFKRLIMENRANIR